jgi:hypothetical protein
MNGPEDYRCQHCLNLVLYRRDHKPDCIHYVEPRVEWDRLN